MGQSYLVQMIVEVDIPGTEKPTKERGVCCEQSGYVDMGSA